MTVIFTDFPQICLTTCQKKWPHCPQWEAEFTEALARWLLPSASEVEGSSYLQSCLSFSHSVLRGIPYDHYPWCFGPIQVPHHTRTPPPPPLQGTHGDMVVPYIWGPWGLFGPKFLDVVGPTNVVGIPWGYMWEHTQNPAFLPKNLSKLFALTGNGVTKPRSRSSHLMKLLLSNFYRPQRSWEGYVLTGVCLSTGEGYLTRYTPQGAATPRSRHPPGLGTPPRPGTAPRTRYTPWDQVPLPGTRYTPQTRCTPLPGTRCTPVQDQVHPPGPGTPPPDQVCPQTRYTPPGPATPPRDTATAADGTHPTGMHSCFENCCFLFQKRVDLLQLMINAHNEARNDDTEHDQEFHDVHGGTERKGISVFAISISVVGSVRPRLVGLEGFSVM